METLLQDLRYVLRQVKKSPGFATVAILTLAVGIGTNTTIFSFVDALYLKPLAVSEPERLVRIYAKGPSGHYGAGFSYPEFALLRDHNSSFTALAVETQIAQLYMVTGGDSEEIRGELVSGNYFSILGVQPALGRTFSPEEDTVPKRDAFLCPERLGGSREKPGASLNRLSRAGDSAAPSRAQPERRRSCRRLIHRCWQECSGCLESTRRPPHW